MTIDYRKAHRDSRYNRESLLRSSTCGCFSCLRIYHPTAITEWIDEEEAKMTTALCPYCNTDAVIGSASGYSITNDFLEEMYQCWFAGHDHILKQQDTTRANQEHLEILKRGIEQWNEWRFQHPEIIPDLIFADLSDLDLSGINLSHAHLCNVKFRFANLSASNLAGANLTNVQLSNAILSEANLSHSLLHFAIMDNANLSFADLRRADLSDAALSRANLSNADLQEANLNNANMEGANLTHVNLRSANLALAHFSQADLRTADLRFATFTETDLTNSDLTGCWIWSTSIGNIHIEGAKQYDLLITDEGSPLITADQLYMAHILSLLLRNRDIYAHTHISIKKMILVIGKFRDETEEILHAVKIFLRSHGYWVVFLKSTIPLGPKESEIITTLSHLALFSIVDITKNEELFLIMQEIAPSLSYPICFISYETDDSGKTDEEDNEVSPFNHFLYRFHNASNITTLLEKYIIAFKH